MTDDMEPTDDTVGDIGETMFSEAAEEPAPLVSEADVSADEALGAPDPVADSGAELPASDEPELVGSRVEPESHAAESDPQLSEDIAAIAAELGESSDSDAEVVEEPAGEAAAAVATPYEKPSRTLSVPYLVYLGLWLVFDVAMVFMLKDAAVAAPLVESQAYPMFVVGGLALSVVGPLLAIVLWLVARVGRERGQRKGLFATALLRGAVATFGGVASWWLALWVLDLLKTGVLRF